MSMITVTLRPVDKCGNREGAMNRYSAIADPDAGRDSWAARAQLACSGCAGDYEDPEDECEELEESDEEDAGGNPEQRHLL
jgi:hypothetical protein